MNYSNDHKNWEAEFGCSECREHGISNFTYIMNQVDCEMYSCDCCSNEITVSEEPREFNYAALNKLS